MTKFPLAGLKIVVTRPRDQSAYLAQHIEQAGGIPVLFPLLDIAAVKDQRALHEQISRLDQFDLAIFISPNAVRYGMAAIRASGAALPASLNLDEGHASARHIGLHPQGVGRGCKELKPQQHTHKPGLQIATVGQGSAKALRDLGIDQIIAPTERFDSEGLLALPELQNIAGWKIIIFRGDGGRELLGDTLKTRGATVEYAACYQRSKPQQNADILLDAAPDAITVTSSEAVTHLWQMLDGKGQAALRDTPLFAPHARIAELARQQGWQQVLLTDTGDDGLLSALVAWAHQTCRLS